MKLSDSLLLAYGTVKNNKLRSGITIAIIAFGIMALIGIITAIDAMNAGLRDSFSTMGANSFSISFRERFRFGNNQNTSVQKVGRRQKRSNMDKPIRVEEAELFKKNFAFPAIVGLQLNVQGGTEMRYGSRKTNPNTGIRGGDENYLTVQGFSLAAGRNLNPEDIRSGRNVCILGSDVATALFGENATSGVDKVISVGGSPYRVIGILKSKGASSFLRADNMILTSYNNVRAKPRAQASFIIGVSAEQVSLLEPAISEATGIMRSIRKLHPTEDDNFVIEKSDKVAETFISLLSSIQGAAAAIGLITLIGAAIGLMNIMLVAVNERTREVGLVKALGGKRADIRKQFLFESTIISLFGALIGIALGILLGNVFAVLLGAGFTVPWGWIITGIVICSLVGLGAGIYPAMKASRLNPIAALRYE